MEKIPLSQVEVGFQLAGDVYTRFGNVLLRKGLVLRERELEILRAFIIKEVPVSFSNDARQKTERAKTKEEPVSSSTIHKARANANSFYKKYEEMFQLLKRTFNSVSAVSEIPVIQLRNRLEQLIAEIKHYNLLTFKPLNAKMEDNLYHKCIKVSLTSYILAKWLNMPERDLLPIAMAGLLHDIGNMKIDPKILRKPSSLTRDEQVIMQQHTVEGYNILKDVPGINDGVKLTALQHHEKEDGSGYPLGVKSELIHIYAKVVAVADIYHAMTSSRIYKPSYSPYVVLEQLLEESFGKLDPAIVQTFIRKSTRFSHGTIVRLSDNTIGEIVFTEVNEPTRPWVKINNNIVNLAKNRQLFIKEVIKN